MWVLEYLTNSQNLPQLASIAQIIGSLLIVLVIIQIRQFNRSVRVSVRQSIADAQQSLLDTRMNNDRLTRAFMRIRDPQRRDSIDEDEYALRIYLVSTFRVFENYHYQYRNRILSAAEWNVQKHTLSRFYLELPEAASWFLRTQDMYDARFVQEVRSLIRDNTPTPDRPSEPAPRSQAAQTASSPPIGPPPSNP